MSFDEQKGIPSSWKVIGVVITVATAMIIQMTDFCKALESFIPAVDRVIIKIPVIFPKDVQVSPESSEITYVFKPAEEHKILKKAYEYAWIREFVRAKEELKKINKKSPNYPLVQQKMAEYHEKGMLAQHKEDTYIMNKAYDKAAHFKFEEALSLLQRIHRGSKYYALAQNKIEEYATKQEERLDAIAYQALQKAYVEAEKKIFTKAIAILENVPEFARIPKIDRKIQEYKQKADMLKAVVVVIQ